MMKKLNSVVYQKLLLQAEEAKDREMVKLDLWKAATCILKYYDIKSADAEKLHEALEVVASKLIEEVEHSLSVKHTQVGPLEPKVPGQSK